MYGCVSWACLVSEAEVGTSGSLVLELQMVLTLQLGVLGTKSGPLQEQQVSVIPAPSLQPLVCSETELSYVMLDDLEFNR